MKHEALKLIVAHAVGTRAGATLNIDDAMPRDAAAIGKCVEGVANEASVTGKAGEERDLAVGGDATARDAPNDGVDEGVRGGRGRQGCVRAMPNVWHQRRAKRVRCMPGLGFREVQAETEAPARVGWRHVLNAGAEPPE